MRAERYDEPREGADSDQLELVAEDDAADAHRCGAERQADAELSHPCIHGISNHAVHAYHAKQQCRDPGDRDEQR